MIIHSWLWLAVGLLTLGAAYESLANGNPKMMWVSILYAMADFVLATIGE